ncbi:phage head spike fiber domain-containing protein [Klebsiella pneumoniae subsp. pneumoniae]|uniref:phage head spike fiber domain-containing protein n=1 Tax=Klebsiella pneumoniae TaxID=573 RepID=UPI003CFA4CCC
MSAVIKSNSILKPDITGPASSAPLPEGAALFADFFGSRFVVKDAAGKITRSTNLKDVLSFNRASKATCVGQMGLVAVIDESVPAIDWNPTTHECLGIRTESASTNRIAWSKDFNKPESWMSSGVTLTANDATSPDGNTTATKLIETAGGTAVVHTLEAITTVAAVTGSPYTFSIWAKANTGSVLQIAAQGAVASPQFCNFDLKAGRVGKSSPQVIQATIQPFIDGWYRCTFTIMPQSSDAPKFTLVLTGGDNAASALPAYIAKTPGSIYLWGAQAEQRDGASSYIPTDGVEGKRAADICTTPTGANYLSAAHGTVLLTAVQPISLQSISGKYNAVACGAVLDAGVPGGHIRFSWRSLNTNGLAQWALADVDGKSESLDIPSLALIPQAEQSVVASYDKTSMTLRAFDGSDMYTKTVTGALPQIKRLCVGRSYLGPENWFNGYIKKLIYWPQSLTEQEMEEAISYQ